MAPPAASNPTATPDRVRLSRSPAVAIVSAVVLLGLFALLRTRQVLWDEAVYLGMAKFLYSGGRSGLWELFRPPLLPVLDGVFWKAGLDLVDASRTIAALFAAAYVFLSYRIAREIAGETSALLAAGLSLVTPVFIKYSTVALSDIPSMSLVLCAIHLAQRDRPGLAGAATGVAFLAKFPQLLVAIPLALYIGLVRRDSSAVRRYAAGLLLPLLGFAAFSIVTHAGDLGWWGAVVQPVLGAMMFQSNPYQNLPGVTLGQQLDNLFYYPRTLVASPLGSILFALAPGVLLLPAEQRRRQAAVVVVLATLLLYYSVIPYKPERFVLFLVPLAAILTAAVVTHALRSLRSRPRAAFVWIALGACVLPAFRQDWTLVRGAIEPSRDQQRELYGYFATRPVAGPILTASPLFTVFSDQRYIPVYGTGHLDHTYVNEWERRLRAEAAAYSDAGLPCRDRPCFERRDRLAAFLDSTFVIQDVYMGFGERWFLFVGRRAPEH